MRISSLSNQRILVCVLGVLFLGLGVESVRVLRSPSSMGAQTTEPTAYTAVLQDYAVGRDGSMTPTTRFTFAVRGDGSRAFFAASSSPPEPFSERIIDYSSGKKMYVLEQKHLKSTTFDPARNKSTHWLRDPHNNCLLAGSDLREEVAGEEFVNGYRTVKLINKSGEGSMTDWLAIDQGCALVKDKAEFTGGEASEKKLVELKVGEPSPILFEDPAGYEEVPFSRMFPQPNSTALDEYYYSHRPPQIGERDR